jgi:hypothetical protein
MRVRDHIYQDVSIFRGEPRGMAVGAFGVENDASVIFSVSVVDDDGIRHYNESASQQVAGTLYAYLASSQDKSTTNTAGLDVVSIAPFDPAVLTAAATGDATTKALVEGSNALRWVTERTQAGRAVFVPFSVLWPTTDVMAGTELGCVDAKDRAAMRDASSMPIGAFLTDPGTPNRSWLVTAGLVVGVVGFAALSGFAYKKWIRSRGTLRGKLSQ